MSLPPSISTLPPSSPAAIPVLSDGERRLTLGIIITNQYLLPFLLSSINIILPLVEQEFPTSASLLSWVPTGYLLAVGALSASLIGRVA